MVTVLTKNLIISKIQWSIFLFCFQIKTGCDMELGLHKGPMIILV
jgi:hypothetical protein